jgi:hypothetical protein
MGDGDDCDLSFLRIDCEGLLGWFLRYRGGQYTLPRARRSAGQGLDYLSQPSYLVGSKACISKDCFRFFVDYSDRIIQFSCSLSTFALYLRSFSVSDRSLLIHFRFRQLTVNHFFNPKTLPTRSDSNHAVHSTRPPGPGPRRQRPQPPQTLGRCQRLLLRH